MTTLTVQKDTDIMVIDEISDRDLLNLCIADPSLSICRDDNFWRERLFRKHGRVQKSPEKTWKTFYLQLVYYMGYVYLNISMSSAARGGHQDLVDFFIQKGANDLNTGMENAAEGGHRDLVEFFIQKGANNLDRGMYLAALRGYKDLVNFFIQKGANYWDGGMAGAARGGHRDLVEFFIQKGARDWKYGMESTAPGHRDLVKFFRKKMKEKKNERKITRFFR